MNYDNILTLKEKFLVFIFILGIIFIPYYVYKTIDKAEKIKKEWNYKVNNCVIDMNFRKDCKLIIYKDMQIHNQQIQRKQQNSIFAGAMVGSMVGSSIRK